MSTVSHSSFNYQHISKCSIQDKLWSANLSCEQEHDGFSIPESFDRYIYIPFDRYNYIPLYVNIESLNYKSLIKVSVQAGTGRFKKRGLVGGTYSSFKSFDFLERLKLMRSQY
jgi:hypothetical protein